MTMEADNQLVRSRLRFLLGKIRVFTAEEETVLNNQLAAVKKIKITIIISFNRKIDK